MIHLGLDAARKAAVVRDYCTAHGVRRVVVLSPAKFRHQLDPSDLPCPHEHVEWAEIIEYRFYYRLLQEIDRDTLVVVHECLRTQNRHELTYNCIRLFLQQTDHRLVFQYLPLIDTIDDFMVLFDFDTRSRWKRERFSPDLLREASIRVEPVPVSLAVIPVEAEARTREAYAAEKRQLVDGIGLGDPHTIPRQLHLLGGKTRLRRVRPDARYLGRNARFKLSNLVTYREPAYPAPPYVLFEFCHNFIDLSDFLALSGQTSLEAIVSDLKVDRWYLDRYQAWAGRLRDAQAVLRG